MGHEKPTSLIQPDRPADMIDVMLTLERPASEQLATHNRREKYALLKRSAAEQRENLIEWVEAEDLSEQVARIGQATVFNTLFVTCTPAAAQRFAEAPGVVSVLPTGDFQLDLLPRPVEKSSPPDVGSEASDEER